jgi:uracil-DNA glycosylase
MIPAVPASWQAAIGGEVEKPYFKELSRFVSEEGAARTVYPPEDCTSAALELTPYDQVAVVLLGQDPYPGAGQAHGLCFSVKPGVKPPASLANMFKEMGTDLGLPAPSNGCLECWARQGVLMLNTVLTVRAGEPLSHRGKGWETFTDAVISSVSSKPEPVVFVLWGGQAQKKLSLIDPQRHPVVTAAHPSPLSARSGFFGSRTFSRVNEQLKRLGRREIDWAVR